MEYTEGTIKETANHMTAPLHSQEYEQAGNSYLMAIVAIIMGLPLPILNLIAAGGYYLAHRKSAYFVRWHCIQSAIGQATLIPFNSIAVAWTLGLFMRFNTFNIEDIENHTHVASTTLRGFLDAGTGYWLYIIFIVVLNISEFIVVISTASRVKNGHNVRWWIIAPIVDRLCSKEDRNPYKVKAQ